MKQNITIAVILVLVLGIGIFLFKISPAEQQAAQTQDPTQIFNLANVQKLDKPGDIREGDHVEGNLNAKNTFIEYGDFQCPACKNFKQYADKVTTVFKDTKLVFRNFPLTGIHQNALAGALAAEASSAQGKFWEMYDELYRTQSDWEGEADPTQKFIDAATVIKVGDIEKFKKDLSEKTYFSHIEKDVQEGTGLSVSGTPTTYFNGHLMELNTTEEMEKAAQAYYVK